MIYSVFDQFAEETRLKGFSPQALIEGWGFRGWELGVLEAWRWRLGGGGLGDGGWRLGLGAGCWGLGTRG